MAVVFPAAWIIGAAVVVMVNAALLRLYLLRRDRNRPGGFTGPGRVGINTLGGRAAGGVGEMRGHAE